VATIAIYDNLPHTNNGNLLNIIIYGHNESLRRPNVIYLNNYIRQNKLILYKDLHLYFKEVGYVFSHININHDGPNFFQISTFNEKSNIAKTKELNYLLRFIAIKRLIETKDFESIETYYLNNYLNNYLNQFSFNNGKKFFKYYEENKRPNNFRRIFFPINTLLWCLRSVWNARQLSKAISKGNKLISSSICFVCYADGIFVDSNADSIQNIYWKEPLKILNKGNKAVLQLVIDDFEPKLYSKVLFQYKSLSNKTNNIISLSSFLTLRKIIYALFLWISVIFQYLSVVGWINKKQLAILDRDLVSRSVLSTEGFKSILYYLLFKDASKFFGKNISNLLYQMEGISWEKCLNFSFKKNIASGPRKIGVINHSVRDFDLRYVDLYFSKNTDNYIPDKYLVNSEDTFKIFTNNSDVCVAKVEAHRMLDMLIKINKTDPSTWNHKDLKLLILGDHDYTNTKILIELLAQIKRLETFKKITIKFHPNNDLSNLIYKEPFTISLENSSEAIMSHDVILTTPFTSTIDEAILANKRVFVMLQDETINIVPNYLLEKINIVTSANDFISKLKNSNEAALVEYPQNGLFLSKDLAFWRDELEKL